MAFRFFPSDCIRHRIPSYVFVDTSGGFLYYTYVHVFHSHQTPSWFFYMFGSDDTVILKTLMILAPKPRPIPISQRLKQAYS